VGEAVARQHAADAVNDVAIAVELGETHWREANTRRNYELRSQK
jgi:hypothetical protein